MELRQAAERSGELAVTATAQPNGVCLQLVTLGVILVESSWGWLGGLGTGSTMLAHDTSGITTKSLPRQSRTAPY